MNFSIDSIWFSKELETKNFDIWNMKLKQFQSIATDTTCTTIDYFII